MKLPHFPFYPSDWLGSPSVRAMTPEQRGVYIDLLCLAWQTDDCSLPTDVDTLARMVGNTPRELVKSVMDMGVFFSEKNQQKISNKRLKKEHEKAKKAYKNRVKTAINATKERKKQQRQSLKQSLLQSPSQSLKQSLCHNQNQNQNQNQIPDKKLGTTKRMEGKRETTTPPSSPPDDEQLRAANERLIKIREENARGRGRKSGPVRIGDALRGSR